MIRRNTDLRFYASEKGVALWRVAEKFGCNDGNFSRKLRKEFSDSEKKQFKIYVDEIAKEMEG